MPNFKLPTDGSLNPTIENTYGNRVFFNFIFGLIKEWIGKLEAGAEDTEALSVKSASTTNHAVSFNLTATSGANSSALNLVSANPEASTLQVSGKEKGRGTVKVSHVNGQATRAGDENAATLSTDLQGSGAGVNGSAGSLAQGLSMTKTTFDVFTDFTFTNASKNMTSATAAFTKEDVGREIKMPVAIKTSGTDTIAKFVSATEVELAGEASKKSETVITGCEFGRNAGAWVTIRDPAKALLFRIKSSGVVEFPEVIEDPTTVEGMALYCKNKKLFVKFGAGAGTEITVP